MERRYAVATLFVILIIATFLRLYHFKTTPPGLYPDEAVNAYNAATALTTGDFRVYYPENNGREGLFMNIQALTLGALGVYEPWALRLPSAAFGILTVLGIYFLTKELAETRAALLASFFAATSVWHIIFSRIGFRAIMAPFFLVWASYYLLLAIRKGRERTLGQGVRELKNAVVIANATSTSDRAALTAAAAGGALFGLGFYSYIAYRVAPLLFLTLVPFFRRDRLFKKISLAFVLAAFVVALPIGLYYLHHPQDFFGRTSEVSIATDPHPARALAVNIVKTVGMFFVYGDANWRHNYAGRPELFWPIALLFLAGFAAAARAIKNRGPSREERLRSVFLLAWLALAALPVVISNEGLPHALRSLLMFPPAMMLAGIAGVALYDFYAGRIRPTTRRAFLVLFLSLFVVEPYVVYFGRWAPSPEVASAYASDVTALAYEIRNLPRSTPVYVVADGGGIDAMIFNPVTKKIETAGFPLASQVVMFITDTFTPESQFEKNIFYLPPEYKNELPVGSLVFTVK